MLDHSIVFAERHVRIAKVTPEIDRLRDRLGAPRQMLQRDQGLVEVFDRLPVGAAPEGLGAGLAEVDQRLLPGLAPERVMSESLGVLGEPVGI